MILGKILARFHGVPFREGGTEMDGLDCLGAVGRISQAMGRSFPETFGSWNKDNYAELYRTDYDRAIEVAREFFDSFAQRIDPVFRHTGDILILRNTASKSRPFLALCGGNGQFVTTYTDSHLRTFVLTPSIEVLDAWRLPHG